MVSKKLTLITIMVIVLVRMLVSLHSLNGYIVNRYKPNSFVKRPKGQENLDEQWRNKESIRLGELVQNRLADLQSREVCNSTRVLVCHGYVGCGLGCRIHSIVICLMIGYATQRTVIVQPPLSPWLQPLGATCTGFNTTGAPKLSEQTSVARVVMFNRFDNRYRPSFYPPAIPIDLSEALDKFHGNAFLWWAGQVARYVFRPTSETREYLEGEAKRAGFSHPIVGIHVRRTDKLKHDAEYHAVEEYMKHVEVWFNDVERTYPGVQRKVFVASDDPTVAPELELKYPNYTFLYSGNASLLAGKKDRYTDEGELGIVHDIYMLSRCDYLVCTLSSNICRLNYEMIQTTHGDASKNLISLDRVYNFPHKMPLHVKTGLAKVRTFNTTNTWRYR